MLINFHNLLHIPVYTQSGNKLGKVFDLNIDIESHYVRSYVIKSGMLTQKVYLIKPDQIIEITKEKMVVEDAVIKEEEKKVREKIRPTETLANVAVRVGE